jgi:hypothetical protein
MSLSDDFPSRSPVDLMSPPRSHTTVQVSSSLRLVYRYRLHSETQRCDRYVGWWTIRAGKAWERRNALDKETSERARWRVQRDLRTVAYSNCIAEHLGVGITLERVNSASDAHSTIVVASAISGRTGMGVGFVTSSVAVVVGCGATTTDGCSATFTSSADGLGAGAEGASSLT